MRRVLNFVRNFYQDNISPRYVIDPLLSVVYSGYVRGYFKNFIKFFSNKVNLGYIITVLFLIIFFGISYITAINKYQTIYIDQIYHKEELAVTSGANSAEIFLEMVENSLLLLSRNLSIINQGTDTQEVLEEYALDWAGTPVLGAARFDKGGNIRFIANNLSNVSGDINNLSFVDRDYFIWAETASEGDTFLGKPLLPRIKSTKLQFIIPLITPMYRNGEFDGVLALAISLPKLTATYLEPLQVSPNSRVYLMHSDSTIIATISGYEGLVGLNYIDYLHDNPYPRSDEAIQSLTKALEDENGGRMDIILYSPAEKDYVRFLIAYYPVIFNNEHWTFGLAVPIDDVNKDIAPFKKGGIMFISIFVVVMIALSAIGTILNNIRKRVGYFGNTKVNKKNNG